MRNGGFENFRWCRFGLYIGHGRRSIGLHRRSDGMITNGSKEGITRTLSGSLYAFQCGVGTHCRKCVELEIVDPCSLDILSVEDRKQMQSHESFHFVNPMVEYKNELKLPCYSATIRKNSNSPAVV